MHSKSSNLEAILKNRLPSDRSLAESNVFCSIKGCWCVLCTSLDSNMFCSLQLKVCTSVDLPIKFFLQSIKVFRSNRLHQSEAATEYTVIELDQPKHTNNINLHYFVTNLCIFWCTFYRTKNKYIPKRTNIRYFGCFEIFRLQFQLASSCSEQTVVFVKSCCTTCTFFF